jgi:hypothetical protein
VSDWKSRATPVSQATSDWKSRATPATIEGNAPQEPSALESIGQSLKAGAENFSNTALLGYAPQIAGGATAAIGAGRDALSGEVPSLDALKAYYGQGKEDAIDTLARDTKQSPVGGYTGMGAGMFASPVNTVLAPFKAAAGATTLAKVGAAAGNGALFGAAYNPGDAPGSDALQLKERAMNTALGGATGGVTQGAIEKTAPFLKKVGSTIFGPSQEAIEKYLGGRERINKAPTVATMKDSIDEQIRTMKTRVQMGEMSVDQAQSAIGDMNETLNNIKRDAGKEYTAALPQIRQSLDDARQELTTQNQGLMSAHQDVKRGLEATPHPREIADSVHDAVATLKGQVVQESGKARDILAESGDVITTKPIIQHLDDEIKKHMVDGMLPVTSSGKAAVERLMALKKDIQNYPIKLKGDDARKLMKQFDDEVSYLREAGGFGDAYEQSVKGARKTIDDQLKQNPDYAAQMKIVGRKAGALDASNKLFGTREKAYASMGSIGSDGRVPQRDVLKALNDEVGEKFTPQIEKYMEAQGKLKNLTPPELPKTNEKIQGLEFMQDVAPSLRDTHVRTTVDESGLPQKIADRSQQLEGLKRDLFLAKESAAPFSKWGKDSTQNKLQSLISRSEDRASIEAQRELSLLDQARPEGEPSYLQSIDDNRVRSQFTRDNTRGSRNALIWRGVGAAAGGILGHASHNFGTAGTLGGGAAGGVLGGYIDKKGGQIMQGALDHYLDNQARYEALRRMNANRIVNPIIATEGQ